MTALFIAAALAALLILLLFFRKNSDSNVGEVTNDAWANAALHDKNSQVSKMLLSISRPVANLPQVHLNPESSTYKAIRLKLNAAGGVYGGSVEVFLSVQVVAVLVSATALAAAVILHLSGLVLAAVLLFAAAFAALPYNRVWSTAKKQQQLIDDGLPEFAELLLMPVSSGYGILPALDFTASRLEGPVASEVKLMLQLLANRTVSDEQAFLNCGERLGSSAAITFFNTLYQAYADGMRVADNIKGQAEQLRKQAFERTRAKLKALPNRLVIIMGIHLLPFLFAVVLLPTMYALGSM